MMAQKKPQPLTAKELDSALSEVYYSPGGGFRVSLRFIRDYQKVQPQRRGSEGGYLVKKSGDTCRSGLLKRFLPISPNAIHQADLLFLPHDKIGRKTYKYALTLVDVASHYKAAMPLTSKLAKEVATTFAAIYTGGLLTWPKTLMVDDGHEFKGEVTTLMSKHKVQVCHAQPGHHRSQAFVVSFNRRLAERLFRKQAQQSPVVTALSG